VAELLTNAAKHSGTRHATLEAVHVQISSPPHGPTVATVELPSHT